MKNFSKAMLVAMFILGACSSFGDSSTDQG